MFYRFISVTTLLLACFSFLHAEVPAKTDMNLYGPTGADLVGDFNDRFMLSLEKKAPYFDVQEWTQRYAVPHIGVYANRGSRYSVEGVSFDFYQWSPPLILLRLPNEDLWEMIPIAMRRTLESKGIKKASISDTENVEGYFQLSGNPYFEMGKAGRTASSPKGYNISFHSSVFARDSKGGTANPLVGIFQPDGIKSIDIPVDAIAPRWVYLHEDASHASSPDNLRFTFTDKIGRFWSLALQGGRVIITYHVMLNDDKMEAAVRKVSRESSDMSSLCYGLQAAHFDQETVIWLRSLWDK